MLRRYKLPIVLILLAALLVATRVALPHVVRSYVNDTLQALEAYDGHVEDVDMSLWRGSYRIEGIRVVKTGAEQPTPFFSAERVDFSVEWGNLARGSLVAEGTFWKPSLNLVQGPDEKQSQLGEEVNWAQRLEALFPFRFNTVRVREGTATFRAPGIRTQDALKAQRINAEVSNLTNVVESGKESFAGFQLTASVLDGGSAAIKGNVNPNERQPVFDVNLALKNVQLPQVNPWLRQYLKADAESGEFELYLELAAAEGKFKGYAKPVMRNVNIYSAEEPESNPLRRLWEGVVDFASDVLENEEQEQLAARVPLGGTIENPEAGIMQTIVSVLRNAFVGAFARSLEGSISLRDVEENLEGIGAEDRERTRE